MGIERQFVFGYGSLAAELGFRPTRRARDEGFVADLPGFSRGWGVAMDNRRDEPGYKYYTAADGSRPEVFVSFLDLTAVATASTNGLCLPVDDAVLARLDRRERNYSRLDVSERIDIRGARVWTYVGTLEGRSRLRDGRRRAVAVIAGGYLRAVRAAFAALGDDEARECADSLQPGDLPVIELTRHDLS
jgi:hypothetical protein